MLCGSESTIEGPAIQPDLLTWSGSVSLPDVESQFRVRERRATARGAFSRLSFLSQATSRSRGEEAVLLERDAAAAAVRMDCIFHMNESFIHSDHVLHH